MAHDDNDRLGNPVFAENGRPLDRDKCNVCGESFLSWSKLWKHKTGHTPSEIDARTIGKLRHDRL